MVSWLFGLLLVVGSVEKEKEKRRRKKKPPLKVFGGRTAVFCSSAKPLCRRQPWRKS